MSSDHNEIKLEIKREQKEKQKTEKREISKYLEIIQHTSK